MKLDDMPDERAQSIATALYNLANESGNHKEPGEQMNYLEFNDAKGRDSRLRVQINHAERAKAALPFEGTLYMSKYEVRSRCAEARVSAYGCTLDAANTARVMRANDVYAANFHR